MLIELFASFVQIDPFLDYGQVHAVGTSGVAILFAILSLCGAWSVRGSTAVPAALWSAAASTVLQ